MSYEFADGYKIRDQSGLYFMTFTVEGWIDLFTRELYRDIFVKNRLYCQKEKGLRGWRVCVGKGIVKIDYLF